MAKQQQNEIVEASSEPAKPAEDCRETIIGSALTIEQQFESDPLKDKWMAWARGVKADVDPVDKVPKYVFHGCGIANLMAEEYNLDPAAYDRARVMEKAELALLMSDVSPSMMRPNELLKMYWVVRLDRSTPGDWGEPRSFASDEAPADWFGGNISVGVLRTLATCIDRANRRGERNRELDVFEYKNGFEAVTREWINSLRNGRLALRNVRDLISARKRYLADLKDDKELQRLNETERRAVRNQRRNKTHQKRIESLRSAALTLQKEAADELKWGNDEVKEMLLNLDVIPPDRTETVAEFAARMTPSDAKALIQALIRLYGADHSRANVLATLYGTCNQIVEKLMPAQLTRSLAMAG
jgi:hypothetical protein